MSVFISFGMLQNLSVAFELMFSMVLKCFSLKFIYKKTRIFILENNKKLVGAKSEEYGDWIMIKMLFLAKYCRRTSDILATAEF